MNDIKNFRDQYNLSQSFLAVSLNISKSQLSMAELGQRRLPNQAVERLRWLEKQMLPAARLQTALGMPGRCPEFQKTEEQEIQHFLEEEILGYRHEMHPARKKLNTLLQRREKALAALALAVTVRGQESTPGDMAPPSEWINMLEAQASTELETIPAHKILQLELKISGLEAKMETAGRKLNALKSALVVPVKVEVLVIAAIAITTPLQETKSPTGGEQIIPSVQLPAPKIPAIRKNDLGMSEKIKIQEKQPFRKAISRQLTLNAGSVIVKPSINNFYPETGSVDSPQVDMLTSIPTRHQDLTFAIKPDAAVPFLRTG